MSFSPTQLLVSPANLVEPWIGLICLIKNVSFKVLITYFFIFISESTTNFHVNGFFEGCVLYNADRKKVIPENIVGEAGLKIACKKDRLDYFASISSGEIKLRIHEKNMFICQSYD